MDGRDDAIAKLASFSLPFQTRSEAAFSAEVTGHTHTQEKVKSTESVKPQNYLSFVSASQLYALPNGLYILFQAPGSEVQQSVINTVEAKQCKEWRLTWKTQPKESRDECMLVQDNSPQGNNTHHCLSKQKSNQTHTVNARTHTRYRRIPSFGKGRTHSGIRLRSFGSWKDVYPICGKRAAPTPGEMVGKISFLINIDERHPMEQRRRRGLQRRRTTHTLL